MSPARSRSSALAAFVGAKGRGNSTPDAGSKSKTKSKSKAKSKAAAAQSKEIEIEFETEAGKKWTKGKSGSTACAPFKPANGVEKEVMWEAQDTAVAVDVSLDVTPASKPVSSHPPPPGLPVRTGSLKARADASKGNDGKENEGTGKKEEVDDDDDMGLSARDVRAYEHERQRVKKAEERAARMARKEIQKAHIVAGGGSGRGAKAWEDAEYVVHSSAKAHKRAEDDRHTVVTPAAKRSGEEISLSDLVKLKPKSRGQRAGREEEFELVPAVRAVIVLDEAEFGSGKRDMEVDDWECVDVEVKEGLSYAQVVLGLHID
ncbi:hypothetical protein JR316_0000247 [Psilocybe cubensis]|uniref:Uncharacterized protein n=2 Tax=Psilocybe cubensis TaxID=181762 RepID=A0ACB8HDT7_PSICU|nr:hypothetical protein JR316_0000247 [Psilocybe cubensis]KAH9486183.1 hypothetical protein JR316_0000247 [Psilocybe cubensis]